VKNQISVHEVMWIAPVSNRLSFLIITGGFEGRPFCPKALISESFYETNVASILLLNRA